MITYERAIEIVNEAYDGLIPDIIQRIDVTIVDLRISDNEIRNILTYILDSDYYHRRISETAPDTNMASFIATRFRATMPTQEIAEANNQRRAVIDEINDIRLYTTQEINNSLNEYIFQSGITTNSDITPLRESIQRGDNYRNIIDQFINLGSILLPVALEGNLNAYYRSIQRINDDYSRTIQEILDRYIIDEGEQEAELTELQNHNVSNLVETNPSDLIDFAGLSFNYIS